MYSRPRFLEELHAIREEMSRECDYDMDLFADMIRNNQRPSQRSIYKLQQPQQVSLHQEPTEVSPQKKKP